MNCIGSAIKAKGPFMHLDLVHNGFPAGAELGIQFIEKVKGNDSD